MSNESADRQGQTRQEIEAALVARAWADPEFKQLLITNPHEAIRQETGIPLPEALQITVLEESPTRGYLVVPLPQMELSDDQLEHVAGAGCSGDCV